MVSTFYLYFSKQTLGVFQVLLWTNPEGFVMILLIFNHIFISVTPTLKAVGIKTMTYPFSDDSGALPFIFTKLITQIMCISLRT